jgi:hypothetical protein
MTSDSSANVNLKALLLKWAERVLFGAIALAAFTFGVDYAIFSMRGRPLDQITVNRYLAVPLKGNKTEFDFQGSQPLVCARAIFPQAGWSPCWYLRRHTNQAVNL